jgi:hypothetical protein
MRLTGCFASAGCWGIELRNSYTNERKELRFSLRQRVSRVQKNEMNFADDFARV